MLNRTSSEFAGGLARHPYPDTAISCKALESSSRAKVFATETTCFAVASARVERDEVSDLLSRWLQWLRHPAHFFSSNFMKAPRLHGFHFGIFTRPSVDDQPELKHSSRNKGAQTWVGTCCPSSPPLLEARCGTASDGSAEKSKQLQAFRLLRAHHSGT